MAQQRKSQPREALKRARRARGLTQAALGEAVGRSPNSVADWEQGVSIPHVGLWPVLARVLQVTRADVALWFDGAPSTPPKAIEIAPWLGTFATLEQGAGELWTFQLATMPGLLQIPSYAAAVQRTEIVTPSETEVSRWVEHRLARQSVLTRRPDRLKLTAVIHEAVLYSVAGDGEVMFDQLTHLAEAAGQPNIDVRVLPFAGGAVHVAGWGSFTVLTSRDETMPYMAVTLDRACAHYLEFPIVVEAHGRLFRHLRDVALSSAESIDLIRTVARERFS